MAAESAEVELKLDLTPFRNGLRKAARAVKDTLGSGVLTPFERHAKKVVGSVRRTFEKFAGGMKKLLTSAFGPLIALFAVQRALAGVKSTIENALGSFREHSDSVTVLKASLETLDGVNVDQVVERVEKLGDQIRLSLGFAGAETNRAFADFVTRGFDVGQAEQLTILAANIAKKTGRPLEDVQRRVADAANGSVDAMKRLGLEIDTTGDRVKDAEAAVLAMKDAYGDIGADLVNPSEQLAGAWNEVFVVLGEKISPIIEPLIQNVADFVTGLSETEKGRAILDGVASVLNAIIGFIGGAIKRLALLIETLFNGGKAVIAFVKFVTAKIIEAVVAALRKLPGGDWLMEKLGFDPEGAALAAKEMAEEQGKAYREAGEKSLASARQLGNQALSDLTGGVFGDDTTGDTGLASIMREGAAMRAQASQELSDRIAATSGDTFAGRAAHDDQAAKEAEEEKRRAEQKEAEEQRELERMKRRDELKAEKMERAKKAQQNMVTVYGGAGSGDRVAVTIKSSRPDRFRKVRTI